MVDITQPTYDDKALRIIAEDEQEPKGDIEITLSSGVILKLIPIPVLRAQAIINRFKYPSVPELWDKKRDRYIRNPDSEQYREMVQQVDIERTMAILDAVIASGSEIKFVPDSLPDITTDEWIEELEVTHVLLPGWNRESKAARKLAWVKYVAIRNVEDMQAVARAANLNMGTSEVQVAEKLQENFPNN